ncbi:MAG TPA: M14 family metallopeptidase, partial [Acidobacteriota bacterium]|nr:M14 family metallopeptidase [Acidobacteriota bacterium]
TNWEETSRYPETISYCKRLAEASSWVRYAPFGVSPQLRDLPLLILSKNVAFTAEEARRRNTPVLLIINGIHSGEIAGKEASLMLLREMLVTRSLSSLLDNVTILMVPIFNVDGHERVSPYNRINQNGPREMGWRATAQNMNLNRDWMKADQPEMQAMLRLYNTWLPHLVIDNHVTDGGDYEYDITYILDDHPRVLPTVRHYMKKYLEPYLEATLLERGHVPLSYFEFRDISDPSAGISAPPLSPRFSDGYGTVQNRPTIVVETHMLKSFEVRIRAHYDLMIAVLEKLNQEPGVLLDAVTAADNLTAELGAEYRPDAAYPLSVELSEESEPIRFRGIEYTHEPSTISGTMKLSYGTEPQNQTIPFYFGTFADKTVAPPLGYVIPAEWSEIRHRLALHGIHFRKLKREVTAVFETYHFSEVSFDPVPYEGRQPARYQTRPVVETRSLPAGSLFIRLNQRCNAVILGLLEPDAPDSLVRWGFLSPIFEEKEYGEAYVLEKLAAQMLEDNEALRSEFEDRLGEEGFASSPAARLKFFYDRSPYKDPWMNAYPIVRVTSLVQIPEDSLQ